MGGKVTGNKKSGKGDKWLRKIRYRCDKKKVPKTTAKDDKKPQKTARR